MADKSTTMDKSITVASAGDFVYFHSLIVFLLFHVLLNFSCSLTHMSFRFHHLRFFFFFLLRLFRTGSFWPSSLFTICDTSVLIPLPSFTFLIFLSTLLFYQFPFISLTFGQFLTPLSLRARVPYPLIVHIFSSLLPNPLPSSLSPSCIIAL